ncbi:MAG: thioredoxin domain-containing protein, partial [Planctomycetota bacterium]
MSNLDFPTAASAEPRARLLIPATLCLGLLPSLILADDEIQTARPAEPAAVTSETQSPANRLGKESSPYLLMHAHNPVDWYAWGPEAFEKARSEKKPIFLSIGYSSCYWCHVMERQTFSDPKVAGYLNQHFVSIKVDREERPDLDEIYMTSLIVYQQAAGRSGGGGWPLSMFLTSDGQPIAGATYLPPEDTEDGRTGFLTAAQRIHDLWINDRGAVDGTSEMLAREVRRLSGPAVLGETKPLTAELLTTITDDIRKRYDSTYGGVDFNPRSPNGPRFPNVPRLQFLLNLYEQNGDRELLKIVDHSLIAMAQGGIRDHLGGGFHRYSTDRQWVVPHFEKMLYDQAQLLEVYSHAARITSNPLYREVADELVRFVAEVMTLPDGGFCSALDAETNAIEGEYYVWTPEQIQSALTPEEAALFVEAFGFAIPQDFEHGRVLFMPISVEELAKNRSTTEHSIREALTTAKQKLLAIRDQRERPFLDDKVLTEWNAQMIQALAVHGRLQHGEASLKLAVTAADFLLGNLRSADGRLLRSWRNGVAGGAAYLDDYACLVSALMALHESTGDTRWLDAATELNAQQMAMFFDDTQSMFFFTSHDHEKLLARSSSPYDSVAPSGNSVAVRNLLLLAARK